MPEIPLVQSLDQVDINHSHSIVPGIMPGHQIVLGIMANCWIVQNQHVDRDKDQKKSINHDDGPIDCVKLSSGSHGGPLACTGPCAHAFTCWPYMLQAACTSGLCALRGSVRRPVGSAHLRPLFRTPGTPGFLRTCKCSYSESSCLGFVPVGPN